MPKWRYWVPETLDEAVTMLSQEQTYPLGGGTDLILQLKLGILRARAVVALSSLPQLRAWDYDGQRLKLGAATTLKEIASSSLIRHRFTALAAAASKVASPQIRNVATLGGNLMLDTMCWYYNQSALWKKSKPPCYKAGGKVCYVMNNQPDTCVAAYRGDTAVALMALDARAITWSSQGERILPLKDLYTGKGNKPFALSPGEIVTGIELRLSEDMEAPPDGGWRSIYLKLSHRAAVDYPLVSVGAALKMDPESKTCQGIKLVLGAVDAKPLEVEAAVQLVGLPIDDEKIKEIALEAARISRPRRNTAHASPRYRRQMVEVLVTRALKQLSGMEAGNG